MQDAVSSKQGMRCYAVQAQGLLLLKVFVMSLLFLGSAARQGFEAPPQVIQPNVSAVCLQLRFAVGDPALESSLQGMLGSKQDRLNRSVLYPWLTCQPGADKGAALDMELNL